MNFPRIASVLVLGVCVLRFAVAETQDISAMFDKTVRLDFKTGERKGAPEKLIAELKAQGAIPASPAARYDYMDYYAPLKPMRYAGSDIVAVQHEYMEKYVGCCVNPGLNLVVRVSQNSKSLENRASKLGCSIEHPYDAESERSAFRWLKPIDAKQLALLRCQQMDANNAMQP